MVPPGFILAFLVGLVLEAVFLAWADRKAIRAEAAFWEELRSSALDGYGKVFDWQELDGDA